MSDAETLDQPGTSVAPIERMKPIEIFRPGGVDDVIARIRREVSSVSPDAIDISTPVGRKARASLAYKSHVARRPSTKWASR